MHSQVILSADMDMRILVGRVGEEIQQRHYSAVAAVLDRHNGVRDF